MHFPSKLSVVVSLLSVWNCNLLIAQQPSGDWTQGNTRLEDGTWVTHDPTATAAPAILRVQRGQTIQEIALPLDRIASACSGPPPAELVVAGSLQGVGMLALLASPSGPMDVMGYVPLGFEPASVMHGNGVWSAISTDGRLWAATSGTGSAVVPGLGAWSVVATAAELGSAPGMRLRAGVTRRGAITAKVGDRPAQYFRQAGGEFERVQEATAASRVLRVEGQVITGRPIQITTVGVIGPVFVEDEGGFVQGPIGSIGQSGAIQLEPAVPGWFEAGRRYRLVAANIRSAWFSPRAIVPAGFAAQGVTLDTIEYAADRVRLEEGRFSVRSRLRLSVAPTANRVFATVVLVQRGQSDSPRTVERSGIVWLDPDAAMRQDFSVRVGRTDYPLAAPVPLVRGTDVIGDRVFAQIVVLDDGVPVGATSIATARVLADRGARTGAVGFSESRMLQMVQGLWQRQGVVDLVALRQQLMGPN